MTIYSSQIGPGQYRNLYCTITRLLISCHSLINQIFYFIEPKQYIKMLVGSRPLRHILYRLTALCQLKCHRYKCFEMQKATKTTPSILLDKTLSVWNIPECLWQLKRIYVGSDATTKSTHVSRSSYVIVFQESVRYLSRHNSEDVIER